MKKYQILLLFLLVSFSASAQKYRTAAGARLSSNDFGFSIQQKVMEKSTVEGIFALSSDQYTGTVLLERHFPILGKGFNYYLGGGAHVGQLKNFGTIYGGDVILGTELKLPIFPLLISFDLKPALHANHPDKWFDVGGGFTLRYILVKEKKEKRNLLDIFNRGEGTDKNREKDKKKNEPRKGGFFGL